MTSKKKKSKKPLIILTAGGTGGHIYPAEALAEELSRRGCRLMLVTDQRGLNNYHGTLGKIPNRSVLSGAVMGKSKWFKIKSLFKTAIGVLQCMYLLLKERPACVVGFGGYASFPCSMAAILLGTDLIVHEQNSVMSRTNRFLGRYATAVAASFKKTKYAPAGRKTVQTGMPIRKAIAELYGRPYPKTGKTLPFNMLVLGGSQGAKVFAEVIPHAIKMLASKQQKRIRMTQQCRREDLDAVRAAYDGAKCTLELSHFFDNMPELYAQTHLIISRAGASSVSEIAAAGIPSILVPLPTAADDHQTSNAAEFKTNKGGIVIAQKDFSPTALAAVLNDLLEDPAVLKTMAENTAKFAITDAAVRLADLIENKIIIPAAKRPAEK